MSNYSDNKGFWNAHQFFSDLLPKNKLAVKCGFVTCSVSGLEGFEEALQNMQNAKAFFCISDISNGYTDLNNTPHTRRVKTIFMAMRHKIDDMTARNNCMETMRELFRQLMTVVIKEKTRIENFNMFIDPRVSFTEIERYFFSGCACGYFQLAIDIYTDLRFNGEEWIQ